MKHLGDITKISGYDAPTVDVVIGGSPCQDLSMAGKRAGLAGERSGLFMEQIRIIKEMREKDARSGRTGQHIRPRYMVWENVPGAASSGTPHGEDFRIVLEEVCKVVDESTVIPRPPQEKWRNSGCIVGDGFSVAWRVHNAEFWGFPQRRRRISLVADYGGTSAPEILFERKGLFGDAEPGEKAWETVAGNVGKSTYPAIARALTARYDSSPCGDRGMIVVFDARGNGDGKTVPTITGDHENRITDYTAICLHVDKTGTIDASYYKGCGERSMVEREVVLAVDFRNGTEGEVNGTLQAKESGGSSINLNNVCRDNMRVRRLTPLECERLQGFPDGWTEIGEWTDYKGKKHKTTDANRYKALGNSIALPFWKWLLKRISAQYERDATMASLFDGIGGFPLLWEQINGKDSCLWASEIEEFCIAVTKFHFGG